MSERTFPPTTVAASEPLVADLFAVALDARERSHSPYSNYRVGAAIRTSTGDVFACCNVENAAYPEGVCAEGGAISMMVVGSESTPTITDVVTVTGGDTPGTPCGGCRQKIREFADAETRVHATTVDGVVITVPLGELLPASFGPERLG
ncbi:cytidine deaminase [Ilumatobacter sp.]|uniref:cytidine deaminase n=1 Tax=Ilumatobacter sp. TaxID=1967498 RepID=UPI003C41CB20